MFFNILLFYTTLWQLIHSRYVNNLRQQIVELEDVGLLPMVLNFALRELNL